MKNDQSYPGEDGARGNCGKSRLFWKAQIVCVSVCERENESERERWGEMGRNTGEFRSDRAQSERPDLFQVTKPKPICQKLFNYPVFSLLLSGSLALGKVKVKVTRSVMFNSVIPWTIQSMEFSRPEYWSR